LSVWAKIPKLVSIVNNDGTDNTSKLGTTGTGNDRLILTDTSLNGWYYSLPNTGEKVLAPAVTFLNKVVFTTFSADAGTSTDPCESPPNSARAYVLDLFNGQAVADLDRVSGNERSVIAGVNEILDAAQIIFRAPSLADGTACTSANKDSCDKQYVEIRVGKMSLPLMDNSNASGAGVAGSVNIGNILPRMFWRDNNVSH
jgi:Tfp pilus tip-associated adhesin PilY1